jgi:hypothetical protein
MTEREWQAQVVDAARPLGWTLYHTHDSRRSEPGWPDLALVRERLVMAELKTDTGRLSKDQQRWIALLSGAGVETYVWRPRDIDQVLAVLKHRRPSSSKENA